MFGCYKKTDIKRDNIYILLFGIPKKKMKFKKYIEMTKIYY